MASLSKTYTNRKSLTRDVLHLIYPETCVSCENELTGKLFDINIIDKLANNESHLFKESHSMRFFKQEDITKLASKHGFEIIKL